MPLRSPEQFRPRCFDAACAAQYRTMDVKKPLVLLALIGSLVACGDNTNLDRGETNCDEAGQEASNPQDASCEETGTPGDGGDGTEGDG